jgi:CheY-like chemotaxis protein
VEINSKQKLLIVEDDEISKEVVSLFLSGQYDIDSTSNAAQALKFVEQNQYAAILMDINLGRGMTGIDLTKKIKEYENYKKVPIVAITAFAMRGDKEEFISSGFDYYLAKPFTREELRATIKKLLGS